NLRVKLLGFLLRRTAECHSQNTCSFRSSREQSSHHVPFPHPQTTCDNHWYGNVTYYWRIVWKLFKRTIDITNYRNSKDYMNPAENSTLRGTTYHLVVSLAQFKDR